MRHVNFLHTILPQLIDGLSPVGRAYVWQTQMLIAGASALGLRRIKRDAQTLGIDLDHYKQTLIANLDAQFRDAGLDKLLSIDRYSRILDLAF